MSREHFCFHCQAPLRVGAGDKIIKCHWCGKTNDFGLSSTIIEQLELGSKLRNNGIFDDAERIYQKILDEEGNNWNARWGRLLCKYGVVYVEREGRQTERVITCRKRVNSDIFKEIDYEETIKLLEKRKDFEQIIQINSDARTINDIQAKINSIKGNKHKYDVFLCYKETPLDKNGTIGNSRTKDSQLAETIYYYLQKDEKKVFFARKTLQNATGADYEAVIYKAIESAEVMIVIGTREEYFTSTWVKSEWARYLQLIKEGEKNKTIIPAYIRINDLPKELSNIQGINLEEDEKKDFTALRSIVKDLLGNNSASSDKEDANPSDSSDDKLYEGSIFYRENQISEARVCFEEAAAKGDAMALYLLGCMHYEDGDNKRAFAYFENAAKKGVAEAKEQVDFMEEFNIV